MEFIKYCVKRKANGYIICKEHGEGNAVNLV